MSSSQAFIRLRPCSKAKPRTRSHGIPDNPPRFVSSASTFQKELRFWTWSCQMWCGVHWPAMECGVYHNLAMRGNEKAVTEGAGKRTTSGTVWIQRLEALPVRGRHSSLWAGLLTSPLARPSGLLLALRASIKRPTIGLLNQPAMKRRPSVAAVGWSGDQPTTRTRYLSRTDEAGYRPSRRRRRRPARRS